MKTIGPFCRGILKETVCGKGAFFKHRRTARADW